MDNLSFNIQENFQDNSVDYAEGQNNAGSLGAITPLITAGNPDFNHKSSTLCGISSQMNAIKRHIPNPFGYQIGLNVTVELGIACNIDVPVYCKTYQGRSVGKTARQATPTS